MFKDFDNQIKTMLVTKPLKINAYDVDVMGIVSNIVYVRWFEDMRFYFLEKYWPFQQMLVNKQSPILSTTEIDYKFPLTIFDNPTGSIWVEDMGKAKWIVNLEIKTDDKTHCLGRQTGYFFNIETKKPIRLPEELRDLFNKEKDNLNLVSNFSN